jgi:hypothetical protein
VDRTLSLCVKAKIREADCVNGETDVFKNDCVVGCGNLYTGRYITATFHRNLLPLLKI